MMIGPPPRIDTPEQKADDVSPSSPAMENHSADSEPSNDKKEQDISKNDEQESTTVKVTPQDVKKLRIKTGAGMLDCKNALIKAQGDFPAAEKILKEQGLASAENRSGRSTNNGSVFSSRNDTSFAMVELTCETDFVARNEVFRKAGKNLAETVLEQGSEEKTESLENIVKESIAVIKENMVLGQIVYRTLGKTDVIAEYLHNEGTIGAMVKLSCESPEIPERQEVRDLAFDLALHVAAYNPEFLSEDTVDSNYIREQKDIFLTQAKNLGDKPEKVIEGIAQGKLKKHLSQICLLEQGFVKDEKQKVAHVISELAKTLGGSIQLTDYVYISVGQEK